MNPFSNGNSIKLNFEVHLIALSVNVSHRRGILRRSIFGTLDDDIDTASGFGNLLANFLPKSEGNGVAPQERQEGGWGLVRRRNHL